MAADIRLAVSVIQTVFAQNHRAAATAADDHANTPNNKKSPSPSNAERGADLKTWCENFHNHPNAGIFFHPMLSFRREFESHTRKLITVKCCA